ncbi:hypothetical protein [Photobacterium galatheae]|uniref:Uncharacterized protein n=1 Tax=Photobacterium galatheae TaxID=1654360 RepID=A0A066RHY6_9GAMM|nr:hypothetical protein [Photobacterium galatheae]KDM90060.1 hypothetical protein EA58_19175 [Photobacterium galatheae]MCM0150041.1 hypothetical protein [Photobacterium galatheae]
MRKFALLFYLVFGTSAFANDALKTAKSLTELVPAGYVVVNQMQGDLNKDNQDDFVLLIKGTDKSYIIQDEYRGALDRNRRGIIIARKNNDQYELMLKNLHCFSSENEDGGVYFPPEMNISINKGNLYFHYMHGRYGHWTYTFRSQNSDFELIGFDSSVNRGPIVERAVSVNFMTRKMLVKENMNRDEEAEEDVFKETWKKFSLAKRIKLSEVDDFDNLKIDKLINISDSR